MNAEIIAVGSELLLGQIANTNAKYLSREFALLGMNVFYHTVVGDNASRLLEAIQVAEKRSQLIVFTGGLGPTKDDLTKETVATVLEKSLTYHAESLRRIEAYFLKAGREMSENNKKQALVIDGSHVFPNDAGMAPGMGISAGTHHYVLFPGPPKELNVMFERYAAPYLLTLLGEKQQIKSKVLRFFGIGESQLETDILDLIEGQTNPTIAPLAGDGEVTLRLTAKHESAEVIDQLIEETEQNILARVGRYFYGYDDTSLEEVLINLLTKHHLTIASAESFTGGLFAESLTRIPGASSVVQGGIMCYSNASKERLLQVDPALLNEFGAVSEQCAYELSKQVQEIFKTDIGVSFTGVAGPSASEGKPPGTVFIGITTKAGTDVYPLSLTGSRHTVRTKAVKHACHYLVKKHIKA